MATEKLRTKPNLVGCPKCGSHNGFVDAKPYYLLKDGVERLEWSCTVCRYSVKTPVMIPEKVKN